ncbi:hypothetical protein E8F20_15110 [Pseudomonas sp. BN415]|uniref:hypothetical protein n=1 Tax=Pseudomonas sp. BN415 TaxID=2567889 RepID=UPI0024589504|nr:hypothetical protein [Pseudomonas sp. BN415]MDH4583183.1 hypothetical protein [Pseudomonas sp. BN415]
MTTDHRALLKKGSGAASAAAGAWLGTMVAGPGPGTAAGAAAGAAVAEVSKAVLDDIANRYLSPREQVRIANTAAEAIEKIAARLLWDSRRDDGFFDVEPGWPCPAEEVFEGVLLAAKQEHEQLKLQYLSNFYANLVFDASVKAPEANHLLTLAESLTYRQLCLLSLVDQKTEYPVRDQLWPESGTIPAESLDVAQQSFYLYQRQLLLSFSKEYGRAGFVMDVARVLPTEAILSGTGKRLVSLMELWQIDKAELSVLARIW